MSTLASQGTLARRLSAISAAHLSARKENPKSLNPASLKHWAVKQVWGGIKRTAGTAQTRKQPVVTKKLRALVAALRRSELVALTWRTDQLEQQWLRRRAVAPPKACPALPESRPASPE